MSEPFVGEIRMFAGNFAPRGWAFCDGQLLAVSQNESLFSLLGTIYGGDGRTTYGLPDLRGRLPMHQGSGPGLSNRRLGAKFGMERETLTTNNIPNHSHTFQASSLDATDFGLNGKVLAKTPEEDKFYAPADSSSTKQVNLLESMITNTGGSKSHNNIMPTLGVHYIIALFGIYPSRS